MERNSFKTKDKRQKKKNNKNNLENGIKEEKKSN